MEPLATKAIESAQKADITYCKFITANDAGETGAHQSGYHIHKNAWPLLFDSPGRKGVNKEKFVKIRWQNDFETDSRFIYYGVGTRNEYRLTRFGKGFPFLVDENIGDVLVLSKIADDYYEAHVLQTEEDIEAFFSAFGISASEANRIIEKRISASSEDRLLSCFNEFVRSSHGYFPSTAELSRNARECYLNSYGISTATIIDKPDTELLNWLEAEFQLFKAFESDRYSERIKTHFGSVEELVEFANTILNRRKSRAGKSLEHHLSAIFDIFDISYSLQGHSEERKRPDFLFPSAEAYHDLEFKTEKLTFLAAKTTCKDRWRQILNEADRIETKHLFTLQQGISEYQLREMTRYGVRLVVPERYLNTYPKSFREEILTLESFIAFVRRVNGDLV